MTSSLYRIVTTAVVTILTFAAPPAGVRAADRPAVVPRLPPPPAPARTRPVATTYFGTRVVDDYRYLENASDPATLEFFRSRDRYARAVLHALEPERRRLAGRIAALDAVESVEDVQRAGGRIFYLRRSREASTTQLRVRRADGSGDRAVVEPDRFAQRASEHFTIDYFLPSPDGRKVAYGISEGGSERSELRVADVDRGLDFADRIDRTQAIGATAWRSDSGAFYYVRFPPLPKRHDVTLENQRAVAYLHELGRLPDEDTPVFGYRVDAAIPFGPDDTPFVAVSPRSGYALGIVQHGVSNELTIYAAPLAALTTSLVPWKKIVDVGDAVTAEDFTASTLFVVTHKNAANAEVLAIDLASGDLAHAQRLTAGGTDIVEGVATARDALYVRSRTGGFGHLTRFPLTAAGTTLATGANVPLPNEGAISSMSGEPASDGVTVTLESWLRPARDLQVTGTAASDLNLRSSVALDLAPYDAREATATSADGTRVPISIVAQRNLRRDGSHPTYLEGYGAYGDTVAPYFSATRLAWLERGGVFAVCHPRGGGWFGESWHRAGMRETKGHTVDDFIACAQYLIAQGYTKPAHLAGEGTSAGGIAIGGAITRRPDLFAAALDNVGTSDTVRQEAEPNGPANTPEFGSNKDVAGFRALFAMSPYAHVRNGTAYPAVLLTTGINDQRVAPWELAKFAARLEAASTSGRPVLMRIDFDAGHGFLGSSRRQAEELLTDQYAFLLWQLAAPGFRIPLRSAGTSPHPAERRRSQQTARARARTNHGSGPFSPHHAP